MIRICILLLSAVLAATAVGQTVAGRVVDDESGEALPSAASMPSRWRKAHQPILMDALKWQSRKGRRLICG